MKSIRERFGRLLIPLMLVIAPAVGGIGLAVASSTAASAASVTGTYTMFNNNCSFGGPCQEKFVVKSNPNNVAIRAYINCYNAIPNTQTTFVGSWVFNPGTVTTTPSCGNSGRSSSAGFELKKTNTEFVQCWLRGGSWGPAGC